MQNRANSNIRHFSVKLDSDLKIRNSKTFSAFKKNILKFIRPSSNYIFNCHSPNGIKLITRLRLGLSHLREHSFRQSFQDTLNSIWRWHYYSLPINCPNYLGERTTLLDNVQIIGETINDKNNFEVSELLQYGISANKDASNTNILKATIK